MESPGNLGNFPSEGMGASLVDDGKQETGHRGRFVEGERGGRERRKISFTEHTLSRDSWLVVRACPRRIKCLVMCRDSVPEIHGS